VNKLARLGDVAEFIRGVTFKPKQLTDFGSKDSIVCMRTKNVQKFLDQTDLISIPNRIINNNAKILREGDLLVSTANSYQLVGKTCWVPKLDYPATAGGFISILRARDRILNPRYLYYWMNMGSTQHQLRNCGRQTTNISNMSIERARDIKIPLPHLKEQKIIAAILDKADAIRKKRKKAIELTDQLLRSVFLNMFGDPVKNPKKWKIQKLKDLSTIISSGSTPVGGSKVYVEQGITFLRSQNVWKKKLKLDDVVYIKKSTHEKMSKTSLKNRDILITKTGRINTENSSLGRAAIFLGKDDSANINGHVYLIRPKKDVINEFILYILITNEYRDYIRSVCVGGIDKRQINKDHLDQFPIISPPIEKQQIFIKCMKSIEKQKKISNNQLELANNMFASLTQQLFNGERINNNKTVVKGNFDGS
jgi:type I restriction enzyme S subunit